MKLSAPIYKLKRQAKLMSRKDGIPLHTALNRTARDEGFQSWGQLAAHLNQHSPASDLLSALAPGDVMLLGARPGHGKTLLALGVVTQAISTGRRGYIFSLDYHDGDVANRLRDIGADPASMAASLTVDTSDDICAETIIAHMGNAPVGSVAVVDYLQLLDQRRDNPELNIQLAELRAFAHASGVIIVLLSQIDRTFDLMAKSLPEPTDIRTPNPLDLTMFSKTCFLHDGVVHCAGAGEIA